MRLKNIVKFFWEATLHSLVLVLLMAMVCQIPWESIGVLGSFGTLIRAIGIATFSLGIIAVISTGRFRRLLLIHYLMILFVTFAVFSLVWTQNDEATIARIMTYGQLLSFVWLIWEFAPDPFRQKLLMQAYIFGGSVGILTQFFGHSISSVEASSIEAQRLAGGNLDLNEFAIDLLMSMPMAVYCALDPKINRILRIAYLFYCPVCALSILLTGSRMGFISMCVMTTLLCIFYLYKRPVLTISLGIILGAPFLMLFTKFMPESTWERLAKTYEELQTGKWSGRLEIYDAGMTLYRQYPVVGTGSGTFSHVIGKVIGGRMASASAHNTYLSVLVELGMVGFLIFFSILVAACIYTFKMSYRERFNWQIIFFTWSVSAVALHMDYFKVLWFLLSLLACQFASCKKKDDIKIPSASFDAFNARSGLIARPR
jgi:O-antigen ligase